MTKNRFTRKELLNLGFSEKQYAELFAKTGGDIGWLAFDVATEPEKLMKDVECTKKQIRLLRNTILKDFPFDKHTYVSCKKGETVTQPLVKRFI